MCIHEDIKKWYSFIAMYMNIHGDIRQVVHCITMHINMRGDITAHAYKRYHRLYENTW